MTYDPSEPTWPDRDRFVLSCGHACILLYSMLYLTGYGVELEDLRQFRQLHSRTPGHPEVHDLPGIEVTTGPLGQGFANGVGLGVAERMLRARFGPDVVDHHTFVICSDGDLMEGISHEAASLAGHLGLGRLIYVYDDNHITIDGPTEITLNDDAGAALRGLRLARRTPGRGRQRHRRPRSRAAAGHGGRGPPQPADPAQPHRLARAAHDRQPQGPRLPARRGGGPGHQGDPGPAARRDLLGARRRPRHVPAGHPPGPGGPHRRGRSAWPPGAANRDEWDAVWAGRGYPGWQAEAARPGRRRASRSPPATPINEALNAMRDEVPGLVAGGADLTGNTGTKLDDTEPQSREHPEGRAIAFGVREHGMGGDPQRHEPSTGASCPSAGTFFVFSDYMRGSVRLAALSQAKVIYFWTHDSVGLGQDGPTHQPIEQLAAMRAMPGLRVIRPADANESAHALRVAIERDGPTALILSRQNAPGAGRHRRRWRPMLEKGAYVLRRRRRRPRRGPDRHRLRGVGLRGRGRAARRRRASPPGWCPCRAGSSSTSRTTTTRTRCSGAGAPVLSVEAAASFGWSRWADDSVAIDHFGASARARRCWRTSASPPRTWPPGPGPCSRTELEPFDLDDDDDDLEEDA